MNYLKRGKMPPMSTMIGLDIVDLKDNNGNKLQLSELEATLIAKNIIFNFSSSQIKVVCCER